MAWFKKQRKPIEPPDQQSRVPEGLWVKCPSCAQVIYNKDLVASLSVCPKCGHHFRLSAAERLRVLYDGEWQEFDRGLTSTDPLKFTDTKPYHKRLDASIAATGLNDAVITAQGRINGIETVVAAMEYSFIGGSMGVVVGEKITRAIERAIAGRMPVIIVSCSGGARMMEGALSLMQMAKISAGLARLDRAKLPYISVLTDPTTGGVTASFAMLGDVNIAEPKALIGFAGPRVIEQTIRQTLPEGFQRSEFLLEHGMLDIVVDRREMKDLITRVLRFGAATPVETPVEKAEPAREVAAKNDTRLPLEFLFSLERLGMKFGLENMRRICAALGHPEKSFHSVIVAGTNGKGSVTAMTSAALNAAGIRSARYTSPHLERIEERFVVGEREVPLSDVEAAAATIQHVVEELVRAGTLESLPTFFECATAIAFELFRAARVDVAVVEVGLGGRLDATNVITPRAAAITSIAFDHQDLLGETLESIAREKAGVVKPGIPVIVGPVAPGPRAVIEDVCRALRATFISAPSTVEADARSVDGHEHISLRTGRYVIEDVVLALEGRHQAENAAVAFALMCELAGMGFRLDEGAMSAGLRTARWPGRLERIEWNGARVILDAAHNPAGALALAAYLREIGWSGITAVVGVMRDKDVAGMLDALLPCCDSLICTTPPSPRALPAASLASIARRLAKHPVEILGIDSPEVAMRRACQPGARVVGAGSIFLIGPLRGILR